MVPLLSFLLQLTLLSTRILCGEGKGKESGFVRRRTVLRRADEWSRNRPVRSSQTAYAECDQCFITYRRNPTSTEAKTRILYIHSDGLTWIYSPRTASWSLSDVQSIESFKQLKGQSIISLCETRLVLFGGSYLQYSKIGIRPVNDTWIFDGETEKWIHLQTLGPLPRARFNHCAFSFYQTNSLCSCKDSLMIFGGIAPRDRLSDMWELRCVEDIDKNNLKYRWIEIDEMGPIKPNRCEKNCHFWPYTYNCTFFNLYAFSANSTHIYWLHGSQYAWIFHLATASWSFERIIDTCPKSERMAPNNHFGATYNKEHQLLIYKTNIGLLGLYNLEARRIHCVNHSLYDEAYEIIMELDEKIYIQAYQDYTNEIEFWESKTENLFEELKRTSSDEILVNFRKTDFPKLYPTLDTIIKETMTNFVLDNYIYQIKGSQNEDMKMWILNLDSLMWTSYDPDQVPGIKAASKYDMIEGAFSVTVNGRIAYFGSNHGSSSNKTDDLWIYTVNVRQWHTVAHEGMAPRKVTSYSTMNSMNNGSLLLFGGIDNRTGSFWMITVNYDSMKATWKKLHSDDNEWDTAATEMVKPVLE